MPACYEYSTWLVTTRRRRSTGSPSSAITPAETWPGASSYHVPCVVNSVIDDQLASDWKIGTVKVSAREGPQTMALFSVATAAPLDGIRCDITISGFVAGSGGGVTAASYILGVNGPVATVVPLTAPATTIAEAGFYSLSVNSSGQTFRFATAFKADGPGSTVNAQLHCTGGAFVATRL